MPWQGQLPIEAVPPTRAWRTRRDPFSKVWKSIRNRLRKEPNLCAKELFLNLQREHPGEFHDGQIRTLRRRVAAWRMSEGPCKLHELIRPILNLELQPRQKIFLAAFEAHLSIKRAAQIARIACRTHYRWLQDATYEEAFEQMKLLAVTRLEYELLKRATIGWEEPVFYQGRQCGSVRRFSDSAAMFLLRHWMPERYGRA
jgi:hypothetical protein